MRKSVVFVYVCVCVCVCVCMTGMSLTITAYGMKITYCRYYTEF